MFVGGLKSPCNGLFVSVSGLMIALVVAVRVIFY